MDLAFQDLAATLRDHGRSQNEFQPLPYKATPKEDLDTFLTTFNKWCEYYAPPPSSSSKCYRMLPCLTSVPIYFQLNWAILKLLMTSGPPPRPTLCW